MVPATLAFVVLALCSFGSQILAFDTCYSGCTCVNNTVRCLNHHLKFFPPVRENTTTLDLRSNKIEDIRKGQFLNMGQLQTLLLSSNKIKVLRNYVFKGLEKLTQLYLYANRIEEIHPHALDGLPNLEFLYLSQNRIKTLHPALFKHVPKLKRLFLYNNQISQIKQGTFNHLKALKILRLEKNPLICNCSMLWFKMFSKELMNVNVSVSATCENLNKSIHDATIAEFNCQIPRIVEHPYDAVVGAEGTVVFRCVVEGDPKPEIHWMLNSNEIDTSNPKYSVLPDGSLHISQMTNNDLGSYECMVKSSQGEVRSHPATILFNNQYEKVKFHRKPEDQVGRPGDTVQLECSVHNTPTEITWRKDGALLTDRRFKVSPEGTLTIQNVTIEDSGTYECNIETSYERTVLRAKVTINEAPYLLEAPKVLRVVGGETATLVCRAGGHPKPLITWFKDGKTITPPTKAEILEDGLLLRIVDVRSEDGGLYTCSAQNTEGNREASGEIRVKDNGPRGPKLAQVPYNMVVRLGTMVELNCVPEGEPKPDLVWKKDGVPIQFDKLHKLAPLGSLRILNVTRQDVGFYQCTAKNSFGEVSAQATLTIEGLSNIDDSLVLRAVKEAQEAVDRAVNSTLQSLHKKNKFQTPQMLFRLFRYPDAATRAFVRPADIYENTLLNIRRHIGSGLNLGQAEDFSYEDVLTREQVQLIANLSGCVEHQTPANCSEMCFHTKYRTIDGTCNNFQHPYWGASLTGFRRIVKPIYEDGFSTPVGWNKKKKYFGFAKPPARLVSTSLLSTETITADSEITHMVMQWGQFLDHDLDHAIPSTSAESWEGVDCKKSCDFSPPCYPIDIPHEDPRIWNRRCIDFIRSSAVCGSGATSIFFNKMEHREQVNQLTSFIDGSQVYGYTENRSLVLRDLSTDLGLLRFGIFSDTGKFLLPLAGSDEVDCRRDFTESDIGCYLAGDIRANEQVGLLSMHTVWLREHNRLALELKTINPHWKGDTLFHEARKIVGAQMQHLTYAHWLPQVIGPMGMQMLGPYKGYDPNVDPRISNVFATAALRFGHTLINPVLTRLNENFQTIPQGDLPLSKAFFSPWRLVKEGGVDPLMRGMFMTPAKRKLPEQNLNTQLTEQLFTTAHAVALDLAAINVQRGRDHGLPGYNEFRKFCNLTSAETFDDLAEEISSREVRRKLEELYGHPGNIDAFVGGILEDQVDGSKMGPTFLCILVEQFRRIRDGDRFWYENPSTFSAAQLTQMKQSSLARVICDNGDNITTVSTDVFVLPGLGGNLVQCDSLPTVDLRPWYDCEDCDSKSKRGRRELEVATVDRISTENTVEELKEQVNDLKKMVKNLRRRVSTLEGMVGCKGKDGKKYTDGSVWKNGSCMSCMCKQSKVTCHNLCH